MSYVPSHIVSLDGYRYYIHFLDDFSRFVWVYPLKLKSDAYHAFIHFLTFIKTQFGKTLKALQSDNGGEYRKIHALCGSLGIQSRFSCPYTSVQNGRAERKHRHIVETGLTLIAQAWMPLNYWWEAFNTAVLLINGLPSSVLNGLSPMEQLLDKCLNYSDLRVFGCACYPYLRPYNQHKLDFHTAKCVYLGPSPVHKGHRCMNSAGRIFISRHVHFNELDFPFSTGIFISPSSLTTDPGGVPHLTQWFSPPPYFPTHPPTSSSAQNGPNYYLPDSHSPAHISPAHPSNPSPQCPTPASAPHPELTTLPSPPNKSNFPSSSPLGDPASSACPSPSSLSSTDPIAPSSSSISADLNPWPPSPPGHPMVTRAKDDIFKPKAWVSQLTQDWSQTKPTRVSMALATPVWRKAMEEELHALNQNQTWRLVSTSLTLNVVGSKWVFRIKRDIDGSIQRYKARLVAKGFHQSPGIDFFETFSPVVKATTIRVVLSLAVSRNWVIRQLDFNNAFLNGVLTEEVYMSQPPDFVNTQFPTHICKLQKAIYGLKQAPRAWNHTLKNALLQRGFKNSSADTSLYIYNHGCSTILLLVYVDDVILTGNDSKLLTQLISDLDSQFALKDLGNLSYFLGIQAALLPSSLLLHQAKYVDDLLTKLDMLHLKPAPSPTVLGRHLSISDGTPLSNPFIFRSTIGALQYHTHTRLDISYIVNHLSQFLQQPTDIHWQAVKRVLRYLSGTKYMGIFIQPSKDLSITTFSDAD